MAVLAMLVGTAGPAQADGRDSRKDIRAAKSNPQIRGAIVYKSYCVLCHGHRGDGMARATKLYGQGNLMIAMRDHDLAFYEKMVRQGGPAVGRSEFMPAWEDELSEEQITDVMAYLQVLTDPVVRGRAVFMTNCILCHGVKGNGKGRASVLYDPPPADLTRSDKNDMYKKMIITMGGAAMGRSEVMPQWGLQLKEEEIDDVILYLRTILVDPKNSNAN
ncbi:hypothetical protein Tel_01345 [Candidatus Tenderia electrophaga]|uniref:Cytochrome c domain-containing protein n=1 Tax=Candidatus Tenderia electrophaga TaxID=1748243 RepID=A0A0S2T9W4_9GAMM|nr:hypothetical protein Tel_01345 [Candidatus Tenderia electrophaga]